MIKILTMTIHTHTPPPGGASGKESACNAGDLGSIPKLGRSSGERNDYLLQYSCLEGYSPWGRKRVRHDLSTTQQ